MVLVSETELNIINIEHIYSILFIFFSCFVSFFFYYYITLAIFFFFFSSRRRHTRSTRDWSSDECSSDLGRAAGRARPRPRARAGRRPVGRRDPRQRVHRGRGLPDEQAALLHPPAARRRTLVEQL